ncbi:MAG: putative iron-sulfur protein [Actinomycetia bacterium]|nr:putative iron-sulfur protein [Actinomycetes bacterium]
MSTRSEGPLGLDDDALAACVACGLCLPHCPTYRVTGLEFASPRGRIAAMREVEAGSMPIDDSFERAMTECVQCRACEAACPSSVPFGHMMEDTRAALTEQEHGTSASRPRRALEWVGYRLVLPHHIVLLGATWLLLAAQKLHLVPKRLALPALSPRSLARRLDVERGGQPHAWLFTGCVMDAWLRDTHRSTARVMRATGATIARPGAGGDCCGALHVHAGRREEARTLARRIIASMPGDAPVVVNSAGCGAAMKEYGVLLDTPDARAFSARVRDFSEWVVERGVPATSRSATPIVVQDPCHLRHVQRSHLAVRTALGESFALVELDDDGLCCGAGGAYAATQPELATAIRDRKVDAIRNAVGQPDPVVASANPGCMLHLRAAGLDVRHPADLLAEVLDG